MKTLILYSSHDGQTQKIAEFIAARLTGEVQVQALSAHSDLTHFDRVLIGASIRYGHFNKQLDQFVQQNERALSQKTAAFFGVNLTARKAGKDSPETNAYVRKFLQRINWQPDLSGVFAGALLYPRYKFFDRIMIQLIMRLTGGETDPSKEIEYTDWQKVAQFAADFERLPIKK